MIIQQLCRCIKNVLDSYPLQSFFVLGRALPANPDAWKDLIQIAVSVILTRGTRHQLLGLIEILINLFAIH